MILIDFSRFQPTYVSEESGFMGLERASFSFLLI